MLNRDCRLGEHTYNKDKTHAFALKKWRFMNQSSRWIKRTASYDNISGAAWGARKCVQPKLILLLIEKPNFYNPCSFLYREAPAQLAFILTYSALTYLQRVSILKCWPNLCAVWQFMHSIKQQYLCQYMTDYKYIFFEALIGYVVCIF